MPRTLYKSAKLNRKLSTFSTFADAEAQDRRDWLRMSARKRLEIVEMLRQMNSADYDPAARRLPRFYTVAQS